MNASMGICTALVSRYVFGAALCALFVSACGGGGGGGGGGESSSSTGVRVLHAAIDAAPVDVTVVGATLPVARKAVFGLDNKYHALPSGPLSLVMTRAATPEAIIDSFAVTADSQSKFSILLYGDNTTFGLRTTLLEDEPPSDASTAHVRVVDGVTGAAGIAVRISSDARTESVEAAFGGATKYVPVGVGAATIRAIRLADGRMISSNSVTLEAGKSYTYVMTGEVDYFVKGLLLADN